MFVLHVVGPDQQLVRHGSVCVYQCRSIYLIGTLELKIFFFFLIFYFCIPDKKKCVFFFFSVRMYIGCVAFDSSLARDPCDGLSCSRTDIFL